MPNRLQHSSSPYLRQHANNPIDWFPWGHEAFEKAVSENKPVFLSIGYSACHWCHVMAHESFEDDAVAAVLNDKFVSIKVDREELPDIDDAYMTAVQLASGRGGWPMTLFLCPDKTPFFAATYIPRQTHFERPGFLDLSTHIAKVWAESQDDILHAANEFREALINARARSMAPFEGEAGDRLIRDCVDALRHDFDDENAGFGSAPKFPPHTALEFLLGETEGRDLAEKTLEAMILGGIHDHVGGGFHRYSTDTYWVLPHFEKMLSDNAQLLVSLSLSDQPLSQLARDQVVYWLEREMLSPEGLFYTALDADSEGEEGLFYTWSLAELQGLTSAEFADAYQALQMGNFNDEATGQRNGRNVLYLAEDQYARFTKERQVLLETRSHRTRPGLDNKCLAAANGLAIRGLTLAGRRDLARKCAATWIALAQLHGDLPHQVVNLKPEGSGYLDDFAELALGLFELYDAMGEPQFLEWARTWTEEMITRFYDPETHAFFTTSSRHEDLFGRSSNPLDSAVPSSTGTAIRCLIRAGQLHMAADCIQAASGWMHQAPQATETLHIALRELIAHQKGGEGPTVEVSLAQSELHTGPSGLAETYIFISIPPGFHIQGHVPNETYLIPTTARASIRAEFDFPVDSVYEGMTHVRVRLKAPEPGPFRIEFQYQACSETECYAPQNIELHGTILMENS